MHLDPIFSKVACAISTLALGLVGCVQAASAFSGVVKEAGTARPVPDAIVAVVWKAYAWESFCVHVQTAKTDELGRYHIPLQTAVLLSWHFNAEVSGHHAYKEGYRDIWSAGFLAGLGEDYVTYRNPPDPSVTSATLESLGLTGGKALEVYKNSTEKERVTSIPRPSWWSLGEHDIVMVRDVAAPSPRLKYLGEFGNWTNCYGAGRQHRNLVPLFERLYAEAQKIAVSEDDKKIVGAICRELGMAAIGADADGPKYEKLYSAYLRDHHPKCWDAVIEASKQSQRRVIQTCTSRGGCVTTKVVIRTCDMLDRCQEEVVERGEADSK
jgi:hypothetical protein